LFLSQRNFAPVVTAAQAKTFSLPLTFAEGLIVPWPVPLPNIAAIGAKSHHSLSENLTTVAIGGRS